MDYSIGGRLTPGVKLLIVVNTSVFLFTYLIVPFIHRINDYTGTSIDWIIAWLALNPGLAVYKLALWQFITYMFFHAEIFHLLFNMLALWMFGGVIEEYWGTKKFFIYYFLTGIGGGICYTAFSFIVGGDNIPTIGASGAIYGLLLAFGFLFPDTIILMFLFFPMKAKYGVIIFAAIEFLLSFQNTGVAHIAHLGGMIFGIIYLKNQPYFDNLTDFEKRRKKKIVRVLHKKEEDFRKIQIQADKILEKISHNGMDTITAEEKQILDKASRLLKAKEQNIINLDDYR